jgi:RNA polymerase sigma factor (sigma-70 family)
MDYKQYDRDGDVDIFTSIYRKYSKAILRYLERVVCDPDLAEDLCQDAFMKIFEKNIRLDPESPRTRSYIYAVARNTAIDHLRKKRLENDKIRSMHIEEAELDRRFYEDIGNVQLRGEILSTLSDVINSFPEEHRRLFLKKNFENRDAASVARDGGTSVYLYKKIEEELCRRIRDSLGHYFPESE